MNNFMIILLSLSISGSIVALGLFTVKPLVRNRFAKSWQYYIWIVVLLRLIVPISPETSLIGNLFNRPPADTSMQGIIENPEINIQPDTLNADVEIEKAESVNNPQNVNAPTNSSVNYLSLLLNNIWLIWIIGAFVLLIWKVSVYIRFKQKVKAHSIQINDSQIIDVFNMICSENAVIGKIPVYKSPIITTPIIIGLFRPRIVLPGRSFNDLELKYVFSHELTHYKRHDLWYKWAAQLILCIHWFKYSKSLFKKTLNLFSIPPPTYA